MGFGKAMFWISVSGCLFAAIGSGIGYLIGNLMPGYYRSVFGAGSDPIFHPVAVGIGQGLTQGLVLGATIGLILVLASWWKELRLATISLQQSSNASSELGNPVHVIQEEDAQVNA